MFKTDRILFPLDYSNVSRAALSLALQIADRHGSELFMLHVQKDLDRELQRRIVYAPDESAVEDAIAAEEQGLREALDLEIQRAADVGVTLRRPHTHLIVTGGEPLEVVLQLIEEEQIDLVVTGTHGPKGVLGWLRGSVSQQLVDKAPCSVFVVKPQGYPYLRD
ncbi:MAG: universal stress protein [Alphaproteobacteria bacterium]|nr:universal stress protein [Alphaproteobacteria bacterium]MCB9791159.1 universal stress protein [Alphaproteobacteria bacterium]